MAIQASVRPSTAFVVDRYCVFGEFAAGGMASVHLAQLRAARGFRRTVAVKRLLPHLTRNQEFVLMLLDEAHLAARINHPNVVTALEVVQSESEVLLVMEYIHGESLAKLLRWASERGERMSVPMACAIVADVLHGLHAAHEAKDEQGQALGVVHRDVSPQNILVGLDGVARVADFGVAKAAGRSQTTRDGILQGQVGVHGARATRER
ncbi:MAG TPA: serine/threonine-protein kinase [Polyangiales bacterium]|nr:serine/threonine-protein kinase [Polyangiales bacterium]